MTTITDLRFRMDQNTRAQLDGYRRDCGNGLHAAACLGAIDGIAASLAASAGSPAAAMALYHAADMMAVREPLEPLVLRSESQGYCSIFSVVWSALTCPHRRKGR
jgi:hypothetical protein